MLREGKLLLRADETAMGAPSPDRKSYFEFDGRASELPAPLVELRTILVGMVASAALELDAALFRGALGPLTELVDWSNGPVLRMSWYPWSEADAILNHGHADIALLTLLPAATAPGLEFLGRSGWERLEPADDEAVMLPGDLTEALGGVPAVRHRVVSRGCERMSASLFVNARPDLQTVSGRSAGEVFARRLDAVRVEQGEASG
jgi:hypothetical protein